MKKLLIFDFDGTIANTKQVYYQEIYNSIKHLGYSYREIGKIINIGLSLKKTLRKFGLGFISSWFLKKKIMSKVKNHINEIKKCKNTDSIKHIKIKKIIITNSLKEFTISVIKHLKLKKCFSEIYTADDFSQKEDFIKDYLKKHKINAEDCIYIGDRATDTRVAKKSGCISVIIANRCSWDSKKEILNSQPDFIISDLGELHRILTQA